MEQIFSHEIRRVYHTLRPSEKRVADAVLSHNFDIIHSSIQSLSKFAEVSQPTIIRFANAIGCRGFKDLKTALTQEAMNVKNSVSTSQVVSFPISPDDKLENISHKVVSTHVKHMEDLLKNLSTLSLIRAVECIKDSMRIKIFGVENSACVADDLKTKLLYMGFDVSYDADPYLQNVGAKNLKENEMAIGISYSGASRITVDAMKTAKKAGAKTICITNHHSSLIAQYSDIVLSSHSEQFMFGNAIFSRCTQIAIIDMLYTGILITDYEKYSKLIKMNSEQIASFSYRSNNNI